jgi:hypothetical protein
MVQARDFYLPKMTRLALRLTQLLIQWLPEIFPLGIKLPEREADHSRPSSAEIQG